MKKKGRENYMWIKATCSQYRSSKTIAVAYVLEDLRVLFRSFASNACYCTHRVIWYTACLALTVGLKNHNKCI